MHLLEMDVCFDDVHLSCPALFAQEGVCPALSGSVSDPLVVLGDQEDVLVAVDQAADGLDVVLGLGHEHHLESVEDVKHRFPDVLLSRCASGHDQGLGDGGRHKDQGFHVHLAVVLTLFFDFVHYGSFFLERQRHDPSVGNFANDVERVSEVLFLEADRACRKIPDGFNY